MLLKIYLRGEENYLFIKDEDLILKVILFYNRVGFRVVLGVFFKKLEFI